MNRHDLLPGTLLTPLRWVSGWMFLSAFHRRVLLDGGKLVMDAPGYVGLKFNQFMPGAILGVDDLIAYLLDRPDALHVFMWVFTVAEGLVGLALLLGIGTPVAAFGSLALSAGILLGAGWLGPTCLDEWQIGSLRGRRGSGRAADGGRSLFGRCVAIPAPGGPGLAAAVARDGRPAAVAIAAGRARPRCVSLALTLTTRPGVPRRAVGPAAQRLGHAVADDRGR